MTTPTVDVSVDADALASSVATRTVAALSDAVEASGVAHLVVTGGSILEKVLGALAATSSLEWSKVHAWWGDERFVAADSPDRNDLPALRLLFDHVPAIVHRMPAAASPSDDADAAAAAYAAELDEHGASAFDVALIGLGPDGHCCSLFPHHPGLTVLDRPVTAVFDSPKPPPTRLSLTFPALDSVQHLFFIASGDGKAEAVARALGGAPTEDVPSGTPRGTVETAWLLDDAAAAKLPAD